MEGCLTWCGGCAAQVLHALLSEQVSAALQKRGVRAAVETLVASSNAHADFWRQDALLVHPAGTCRHGNDGGWGWHRCGSGTESLCCPGMLKLSLIIC